MPSFRLSRLAEADLIGILAASRRRWGADGRRRYAALLAAAMRRVAAEPEGPATRRREELRPGIRSFHLRHTRSSDPAGRVRRPVRGRGPHDRPAPLLPVLRLGEAEQPVDGMHQAWRDAEPRRRRLEGREQLSRRVHPLGQPGKAFRGAVGLEQPRRQPPEAGGCLDKAPPWRPWGAIFLCHRDPPFGWIATGKPSPLTETAISV
jgi:toxin ParE1/3/4